MELNIVTAPRRNSYHWEQSTISWDELVTWMIDPADTKESGNYILGTLRETTRTHGNTTCTDLHRNSDAIVTRDALMLDVDYPEDTFLTDLEAVGVKTLVHTTFSSTPDKPRYRVIIPLSRPVSPFEYETAATDLMERVGPASFDATSPQPERYMFRPAGEHFWFTVFNGPVMEPPAITPELALAQNLMPHNKRDPFELTGAVGAFNRVYTDLDTLIEEFSLPYEKEGTRWRYKGTVSAPGMDVIAPGLWWSDHATDPASGHAQTAFDLVRIHVYGDADLTAKPGTVVSDLPSQKKALEFVEGLENVRQDQLAHEFGPASKQAQLGYDPDSTVDAHLARNLADRGLEKSFRHVVQRGWLHWDGRRWAECDSTELWMPIHEEIRTLVEEWTTSGKNPRAIADLKRCSDAPRLKRLIEMLRPILGISPDALDAKPDLLNVGNGTVNLRTGELKPHSREDYLTVLTETPYVPGATHTDWDTTLSAILPDAREWMQIRCGQGATGHRPPDDVTPILQGGGANGKTTFTGAIMNALGDHAVFLPERAVFSEHNDHPTELMTLRGARFALMEETPEGKALNIKRLKDILGAERISARKMRQDTETFKATHSLFITTNYHPKIVETDEGTWRRLSLVEFPFTFRPGATGDNARPSDPHLRTRLEQSRDGQNEAVLAWLVAGAMKWYAADEQFPEFPPSVVEKLKEWREMSDPLHGYVVDRLVKDPGYAVQVSDLYEDFVEWQEDQGHTVWAERTFANRFRQHEGVKALGAVDTKIRPASKKEPTKLSHRDPLTQTPDRQIRVWKGIRFA